MTIAGLYQGSTQSLGKLLACEYMQSVETACLKILRCSMYVINVHVSRSMLVKLWSRRESGPIPCLHGQAYLSEHQIGTTKGTQNEHSLQETLQRGYIDVN